MKRISYALFPFICLQALSIWGLLAGPTEKITLDDIYRYHRFSPETLTGICSMNDGIHYTVKNGGVIDQYSYKTGERTATIFDASEFAEMKDLDGYSLSTDGNLILVETGHEKIYRHSYCADFYVYNRTLETLTGICSKGKQQLGELSPDGTHVAFVMDNNLYIRDLQALAEIQATFDGCRNQVINGAPDWVYEEEFGFSKGFCWSPDSRKIAFYRFDESRVKQFHMTIFGPLYPEVYEFKYPKAGEENAQVSILVYDLDAGEIRSMDIGKETDQYIPRIKWTADPNTLSIIRLNRLQNRMELLHADVLSGESKVVYREENLKYISEVTDQTINYLADNEHLILNSERDGYFHLYLCNFNTGAIQPITTGDFDVHTFLGYDEKNRTLYYTSYEESTIEIHLYSILIDGTGKKKLSIQPGTNSATFSNRFDYFLLEHSSANTPPLFSLHDRKGKLIRYLVDNEALNREIIDYGFAATEFLTVPTASGLELNAWMIKPADFDPSRKYPLFIYVYGGPESQNVTDSWGHRTPWFQMLAQQGYIVACVDNRGTNGRGEAFRKATYLNLGKLETLDQLEAARWFGSQSYIDEARMGIFGWSYGGYMTSLCMTRGEGTFRIGIAVAPVTSWRYYDTIYTERFLRTPRKNPEGYDGNSPLHFASGLEGKFLLVHGSSDDNVHFQNTMDFAEALIAANKQFEMQIYPNQDHGISRGNSTYHLYCRITDFILENL